MALTGWSVANYLQRLEAVWPGQLPFLVSIWCWQSAPGANGLAFVLGQQGITGQEQASRHIVSTNGMEVSTQTTGPTASAEISPAPEGAWFHILVGWISPTLREIWLNGGSRQTNTDSRVPDPPNFTAVGIRSDISAPWQTDGALAECSIWNAAGLDLQARGDLAAILFNGTNPLATNSVGGAPWQGNLVETPDGPAYASMHTPEQLGPFEMVGSLGVFEVAGTPSHPPVAVTQPQIVRTTGGASTGRTVSVPIEVTADDGPDRAIIAMVGWRVTPTGMSPTSVVRGAQQFTNLGPLGPGSFIAGVNAKNEFWGLVNPDVGTFDVVVTGDPSQDTLTRGIALTLVLFRFIKQGSLLRNVVFEAIVVEEGSPDPVVYSPDPDANLNELVLGGLAYGRGGSAAYTLLEGLLLQTEGVGTGSGDARVVMAANVEDPVVIELISSTTGNRPGYAIAAIPNSSFLPDPPTALTVDQANDQEAFLSWSHASGEGVFYELQRAIDVNGEPGTYNIVVDLVSETDVRDDEVGPGNRYWWRVRTQEGGLLSDWSAPAVSTMAPARPATMSLTEMEP